jgi:hypothetical protein
MTIKEYILEVFVVNQNDGRVKAIAKKYDLGKCDKGTARWDTEATYVYVYGDATEGEYCDVEVQVGQGDSGLWYLHTTDDAGGSDDMDATAYLTEDEARQAANDYAEENDESEDAQAGDEENEDRQERIDKLTSDDGDWQIVDGYDRVVASADTEEEAEELMGLLKEQDKDGNMGSCSVVNQAAEADDAMETLIDEDGDWGVVDMDGAVIATCASEADAEAWIEAESTSRSLSLRGRQGFDNCYWPRSVVQISKGFARVSQYSTAWS